MDTPHPQPPAKPAITPPRIPIIDWRPWVLGGSIFYLSSAVCILIGVYQIIVPIYARPDIALEKFACLTMLNVYELLLITITLLIVLWRHVTDDAVLLAFLVAAFLIGSATALDTIAPDFPGPTLAFGAAGLLLAASKVYALGRWITGRMSWLAVGVLGILLAWNFLMPGLIGLIMAPGLVVAPLRQVWLAGGLVTLTGGAMLVAAAWRLPSGTAGADDRNNPFLSTSLMRWSLVLLILGGVFVHQYALNWAFGLNFRLADLLPALAMISLLLVELRRGYASRRRVRDLTPLLVTLLVVTFCTLSDSQTVWLDWSLGVLSFAPIVAFALAGVIEIMAWRHRWPALHAVALGYLAAGCWGITSTVQTMQNIRGGWLLVALAFPMLLLGAIASLLKSPPRCAAVNATTG